MRILPHIELTTGAEPAGTVIWLHGLGADGWYFVPVVRELPVPETMQLRFIFPHAPERAVTINNGYVMRAWYDIKMNDIARLPDEEGIRQSQAQVEEIVAREVSRGVPSDRVVLAGFSQGGAIALQTGLRMKQRLGGIVALSTYLPLEESLDAEAAAINKATPIFIGHGIEDAIVPLRLAELSKSQLERRGYDVTWHTWPMPHAVCAEELEQVAAFLARALGGESKPRSSILLMP